MKTFIQRILRTFTSLASTLAVLWAAGALAYDFPWATARKLAAVAFVAGVLITCWRVRGFWKKCAAVFLACLGVSGWWLTLTPSNQRSWQPDVAQTAWAEVADDVVTLHNVRDCDYRTETDYTPRWMTRTVRLSQLTGMDIALCYWGSPWMAHPIVSFQLADEEPVCFSIETRKEVGENYSAIGGLYRQYELTCIVANERDVLRVRTNFRKGEDVHLYRTTSNAAQARTIFLEYVESINSLHNHPRWYNAITANCTTSIRSQRDASKRAPWDWRLLLNGKGDEMLYERGRLATGGKSFADLKAHALINKRANDTDSTADYSRRIRAGVPGF